MTPAALRRHYAGRAPFEEVWFAELVTGPGEGLWIRYVLCDGVDPHASLWAAWFGPDGVTGHVERLPLDALDTTNPVFGHGAHWLDAHRAVGQSGPISWDLTLANHGPSHAHYPWALAGTGLAKRIYQPAFLDLAASGTVRVGDRVVHLTDARGVLGHIFGTKNVTIRWAWAHASFDGGGVFEALTGQLALGPVTAPRMTSAVLHLDGHTWGFSRTRDLLRTKGHLGTDTLSLRADRGPATLEAHAGLPRAAQVALVAYADPAGGTLYCRNSRLAPLTVRIVDPSRGVDRTLVTSTAAFEIGGRDRPAGEVLLP